MLNRALNKRTQHRLSRKIFNGGSEMADPTVPVAPAPVPFYKTTEGQKDLAVLAGIALDVVNFYIPMLHPGLPTAIGLAVRASLNL